MGPKRDGAADRCRCRASGARVADAWAYAGLRCGAARGPPERHRQRHRRGRGTGAGGDAGAPPLAEEQDARDPGHRPAGAAEEFRHLAARLRAAAAGTARTSDDPGGKPGRRARAADGASGGHGHCRRPCPAWNGRQCLSLAGRMRCVRAAILVGGFRQCAAGGDGRRCTLRGVAQRWQRRAIAGRRALWRAGGSGGCGRHGASAGQAD